MRTLPPAGSPLYAEAARGLVAAMGEMPRINPLSSDPTPKQKEYYRESVSAAAKVHERARVRLEAIPSDRRGDPEYDALRFAAN